MSTYTICTRCGKQVLPFDTVGTGTGPTIGYCACQPQTGWGNPSPLTPLLDWRDAELARLRAALAEAERERDEARATRDELQQALSDGAYTSPDLSDFYLSIIERQRRTIRALVVAARAMWWCLMCDGNYNQIDYAAIINDHIKQAERGQAGKE